MKSEMWIGRKEEQTKKEKGKRKGKEEGTLGEACIYICIAYDSGLVSDRKPHSNFTWGR